MYEADKDVSHMVFLRMGVPLNVPNPSKKPWLFGILSVSASTVQRRPQVKLEVGPVPTVGAVTVTQHKEFQGAKVGAFKRSLFIILRYYPKF